MQATVVRPRYAQLTILPETEHARAEHAEMKREGVRLVVES